MSLDFEKDHNDSIIAEDRLDSIVKLADEMSTLEKMCSAKEDELKRTKEMLREVREERLPSAMRSVGLNDFTLLPDECPERLKMNVFLILVGNLTLL